MVKPVFTTKDENKLKLVFNTEEGTVENVILVSKINNENTKMNPVFNTNEENIIVVLV